MNTETVDRTAEARHVALANLALSDLNPRQTADPKVLPHWPRRSGPWG